MNYFPPLCSAPPTISELGNSPFFITPPPGALREIKEEGERLRPHTSMLSDLFVHVYSKLGERGCGFLHRYKSLDPWRNELVLKDEAQAAFLPNTLERKAD